METFFETNNTFTRTAWHCIATLTNSVQRPFEGNLTRNYLVTMYSSDHFCGCTRVVKYIFVNKSLTGSREERLRDIIVLLFLHVRHKLYWKFVWTHVIGLKDKYIL